MIECARLRHADSFKVNPLSAMRICLFLFLPLLCLVITGCDQQQSRILAMQDDFQRQIQAKEKTIDELRQSVADLRAQNSQMDGQLAATKQAASPDQLAAALATAMQPQTSAPLRDIASKLEVMQQTLKTLSGSIAQNSAAPATSTKPSASAPTAPAPVEQTPPAVRQSNSDPSVKKFKFDF
jgi:cell division protein FtsB